ncbi:MAG TPA: ZIP family metal transporter [Alphaproteobacteria bacterium]|nr:ZIP family metal transporter [Alphaproteobacteria bacterium]
MINITLLAYIIASVIVVSLVSLIGVLTIFVKTKNFRKILLYFVSFSVGALFGDVFIHLIPEAFEEATNGLMIGFYVLAGIIFSFIIEKFVLWRHCHRNIEDDKHNHDENHYHEKHEHNHDNHIHSFAYMNLVGDTIHNFIDGLIIAGAYFISIPVGVATTVAVIFHEIPQEIGSFGVLLHGGFSRAKALFFNFLTALSAVLGAIVGILFSSSETMFAFLIPFAAGNLLYIAGTDLIPELNKHNHEDFNVKENLMHLVMILLGIGIMCALLLLE